MLSKNNLLLVNDEQINRSLLTDGGRLFFMESCRFVACRGQKLYTVDKTGIEN